jgi:hypothetical protein
MPRDEFVPSGLPKPSYLMFIARAGRDPQSKMNRRLTRFRSTRFGVQSQRRPEPFARLAAKARAGQWSAADDIDWRRPPRLPPWITRDQARAAISQLYHGEIATSRMCRTLLDEFEPGPARQCLEFQITDELRHAEAFKRYLESLGGVADMHKNLAWALEAAGHGPAGPLGAMVAFHVVVEGEVLRVQDSLSRLLPCPLLKQINRRVARDEARHVAFGRIYLTQALADLSTDARSRLHGWVHDLWRQTTDLTLAESAGSGAVQRILRSWLRGGWRHHEAALHQIGLAPGPDWGRAA